MIAGIKEAELAECCLESARNYRRVDRDGGRVGLDGEEAAGNTIEKRKRPAVDFCGGMR